MAKNIVLCLDGTNNKIRGERFLTQDGEKSAVNSNVARFYNALDLADATKQVALYQPGVGTFGAVGAWTPASRELTRMLGLALGYGLRRNLAEAFTFLATHYEPEDQISLVGFSRGAYTARAISGMLELVGILRPGASNLVPSVVTEYTRDTRRDRHDPEYFDRVRIFSSMFSEEVLDRRGHVPIRFVGLWDTVEAAGSLRGRTKWSFTGYLPHAAVVRHAVAIDEQRRPYREYLVTPLEGSPRSPKKHLFPMGPQDLQEVWFAGVHSDVGGMFKEGSRISDIPLSWMLREADHAGLLVRPGKQQKIADMAAAVPADAPPHVMEGLWRLMAKRRRRVPHHAAVHDSVRERRELDPGYGRHLPADIRYVDRGWRH
jgi:uncharacterized protein (DUF2235 family)